MFLCIGLSQVSCFLELLVTSLFGLGLAEMLDYLQMGTYSQKNALNLNRSSKIQMYYLSLLNPIYITPQSADKLAASVVFKNSDPCYKWIHVMTCVCECLTSALQKPQSAGYMRCVLSWWDEEQKITEFSCTETPGQHKPLTSAHVYVC